MVKFLYLSRVSSVGQNSSRQIESFRQHGYLASDNVFIDKCTGNTPFFERPEAVKLFEVATSQSKDVSVTVVIDSIDRLGRNLMDILKTIEVFNQNKINLKSLKEGFETLLPTGGVNPMSQILIGILGTLAEFERTRIRERQAEGIAIGKVQGKFKGRKVGSIQSTQRLLERYPIVVNKLKKGLSVRDVGEITGNSTTTIMKVRKALAL